jgi:hypothetical protein
MGRFFMLSYAKYIARMKHAKIKILTRHFFIVLGKSPNLGWAGWANFSWAKSFGYAY